MSHPHSHGESHDNEKKSDQRRPPEKKEKKAAAPKVADSNIGEGDRVADKKYRDDVRQFVESDNPEKRARDAQSAIARDPQKFADAERAGKKRIAEEDPEVTDGSFEESDDADL